MVGAKTRSRTGITSRIASTALDASSIRRDNGRRQASHRVRRLAPCAASQ
jgi:hypothetical protein